MPNTKSAERRMRSSVRKQSRNKSVAQRLHTLEKNFRALAASGKKDEATTALRAYVSAVDKAAKGGSIHKSTAGRKKSRLASQLNRTAAAK